MSDRSSTRHASQALSAFAFALLIPAALGTPALAHAAYESSDPPDGGTVSSPPSRVTAEFTEPMVDGSYLTVTDPCGVQVDNRDSLVAADRLTVSMSADKQGTYTVRFDVVSSVDGHGTTGSFSFTSSGGAPCAAPDEPSGDEQGSGGDEGKPNGGAATNDTSSTGGDTRGGSNNARVDTARREEQRARDEQRAAGERQSASSRDRENALAAGSARNEAQQVAAPVDDIRNIWRGIPIGPLLFALAIAAAIGAAGGNIYAGIMGWTKPHRS